ncbi:MAG: hypothetical protein WBL63_17195 [Candidatus Acidiferrum sp.]
MKKENLGNQKDEVLESKRPPLAKDAKDGAPSRSASARRNGETPRIETRRRLDEEVEGEEEEAEKEKEGAPGEAAAG